MHHQPPPSEQPEPDQPTGPRIRWLDVRFNGSLVCRVNANDPTHIQMVSKTHGQRKVIEVSTKSMAVTGF
jgi:hypothetical protein